MAASARWLLPAEAARRLGVSTKALRVYEAHGLLVPARSPRGWRLSGRAAVDCTGVQSSARR